MRWRGSGLMIVVLLSASVSLLVSLFVRQPVTIPAESESTASARGAAQPPASPMVGMASDSPAATPAFRSRAGSRKAVPVTRGQELGLRFRPDDRDPYYASPGLTVERPGVAPPGVSDHAFRPTPRKRRPTYEELQAGQQSRPPAFPATGYPAAIPPPLPMPPTGVYW